MEIKADCDTQYKAYHNSGTRALKDIKWIVLHSTEGDSAKGTAEYFTLASSGGSAHLVVDDDECYRTLTNDQVPWAAPGANEPGFHIEQSGHAAWTKHEWLSHDNELRRSAYKAAYHAKLFNIPLRWVGPIGLRLGRKGITTHRDVSYAWPLLARKAGFHTDPGPNFPKEKFLAYATEYYSQL